MGHNDFCEYRLGEFCCPNFNAPVATVAIVAVEAAIATVATHAIEAIIAIIAVTDVDAVVAAIAIAIWNKFVGARSIKLVTFLATSDFPLSARTRVFETWIV